MTTPQGMLAPCPFCGSQPTHWPHLGLVKCECHAQALDYRWNTRLSASPAGNGGRQSRETLKQILVDMIQRNSNRLVVVDYETTIDYILAALTPAVAPDGAREALERIAALDSETWVGLAKDIAMAALARHPHQPVEDKRAATLSKALADVRQELWVDYCLDMGRTDTDPRPFDSKPHIRIIDSALAHPLEPATEADLKPYYSDDPDCIPGN